MAAWLLIIFTAIIAFVIAYVVKNITGGFSVKNPTGPASRKVQTESGPVVGVRVIHSGNKQVDAFLGVPFAKPPVGKLRLQKPQKPDPWKETKKCTKFAARSIQNDAYFWTKWNQGPTSEDSLYLNVFTPAFENPEGPDKPFPVMVYIHGGGFVSESAVKFGCEGISKHLVTQGVVVVTIQYRLGYLGFWASPDGKTVPGNLGLWDQTFALRWVQDNIANFNGDPSNVTVLGQSAGGASVDLLTLSPHSRDLFHKVVPMAGNSHTQWVLNDKVIERCQKMTEDLGIQETDPQTLLAKLQDVDAANFGKSLSAISITGNLSKLGSEIGPRLDGDFFPKTLDELRAEAPKKPRLIGTCTEEGLFFILSEKDISLDRLKQILVDMVPDEVPDAEKHRAKLLQMVIDPENEGQDPDKVKRAITAFYSDVFLNIGTQRHVIDAVRFGAPTWLYSFDHYNPSMWGLLVGSKLPWKASTHCTELSYMLAVGIISDFHFNKQDYEMLRLTTKLWTNFAKYGNPNGSTSDPDSIIPGFRWESVTAENPHHCLSLTLKPVMKKYHDGRPLYWAQVFGQIAALNN